MVTASQTLKMYELLNKHFKNTEDAKVMVASIEEIVENKFNDQRNLLATKDDIFCLKSDISKLEIRMEQGFKDQLKWTIVLMLGMTSLFVAAIKLL